MISTPSTTNSVLDKRLPIPGWYGWASIIVLTVAVLVRVLKLDVYLLGAREAEWAYDSYSLYYGRPLPIGQELPESGVFVLLWNTLPFYLFGVTDASARAGSALLGIALVGLAFGLRPFLSKAQVVSVAAVLALSPTVLFASRTIDPGMPTAFMAMLVVVALLRSGLRGAGLGWTFALGAGIAGLYGTGPLGVSTLIALGVGVLAASIHDTTGAEPKGAIGTGVRAIVTDRRRAMAFTIGLVVSLLALFTRSFSDLSALSGLWTTMSDWLQMMSGGTASVPAMFYFWGLLLYETFFVVLAIAALVISRKGDLNDVPQQRHLTRPLFIGWFVAALLLHTFASMRDTSSMVLVALPMLLLAGVGIGKLIDIASRNGAWRIPVAAGLVVVLLATAHTAYGLAFERGVNGTEPLARDIPAAEARELIDRVYRLSRDVSSPETSTIDPTGRYGITIAVTPELEWPFTWYFRDFPFFTVTPPAGFTPETDIAIGTNADAMESVGLTPSSDVWNRRPADPLSKMSTGSILRTGLNPANWGTAWDYMVNRESGQSGDERTVTVGYSVRAMNKMTANVGPFDLFSGNNPGSGGALGQLQSPAGVAVGSDGTIYVLNAGNTRVDRYDPNGHYLGIWSGQSNPQLALSWSGFQGGTGITVGPDGLVYIADTWNHVVVVVRPDGTVVRMFGSRGTAADITDQGKPHESPGLFFGPRSVAVSEDRVYVTDTGNERVQVFSKDGTFLMAFGGFGEGEGQMIEPTGITIAADGTVWVADSGNSRLQQFSADGEWLASHDIAEWEQQEGSLRMNYLAFGEDGVLYTTSPLAGVIAFKDGETAQVYVGDVSSPAGIVVDDSGNLLVVDATNGRVVRLQPNLPDGFTDAAATPQASPAATPQASPVD